MIADTYDESRENTLRGMIGEFYNRKNTSTVIVVWAFAVFCIALAVYCGIAFFRTGEIQLQLMYAVIFVVMMQWMGQIKIFAWLIIHRNGIKREIKRLELRIAELNETVKSR